MSNRVPENEMDCDYVVNNVMWFNVSDEPIGLATYTVSKMNVKNDN